MGFDGPLGVAQHEDVMLRVIMLSAAGFVVFLGFGLPFLIPGETGLVAGIIVLAIGVVTLGIVQYLTEKQLDRDTFWNRFVKKGGSRMLEHRDDTKR